MELAQLERLIRGAIAAVSPPGRELQLSIGAQAETENTTLLVRVAISTAECSFDLLQLIELLRQRSTVTMCLLSCPPEPAVILHGASNSLAYAIVFDWNE